MGRFAGGACGFLLTFVYLLCFLASAIGIAIYSYFLAKLSYNNLPISNDWRAVEGITGAAVLFCIFALLLTCFVGGKPFCAIIAIILDFCFMGAMVAVAVLTRSGANSCSGPLVRTPLGVGPGTSTQAGTNQGTACRLNTAVFGSSIAAAVLFLIAMLLQFLLMRNHQKEKRVGPSPSNDYTYGTKDRKKFFKKKQRPTKDVYENGNGAELGAIGATNGTTGGLAVPATRNDRISDDTGYTGTTTAPDAHGAHYGTLNDKYETSHGGYGTVHAGPGPTAEGNPYGYHPTGTATNY